MSAEFQRSIWSRGLSALRHELRYFAAVSLYFYIYFCAVLLYKTSILREQGVAYVPFGLAAIKALVIGKFFMVGQAIHLGDRSRRIGTVWHILHKVVAFVALLLALSIAEEIIMSLIHGQSVYEAVSRFAAETWQQVAASCLLGFLALTPLIGIEAIAEAMGAENFRRLLFGTRV